ncbi:MAG TPA: hypothetical protein DDW68_01705, partial [Verrucomicrobiales bacterium]|nr:hypothetical protein [Verrucomicrobiales bacterium]
MNNRRDFLRKLGISSASLPFLTGLPGFAATGSDGRKQRIIFMFSPNGTLPDKFWPGGDGKLVNSKILSCLAPFENQTAVLKGLSNRVGGDG